MSSFSGPVNAFHVTERVDVFSDVAIVVELGSTTANAKDVMVLVNFRLTAVVAMELDISSVLRNIAFLAMVAEGKEMSHVINARGQVYSRCVFLKDV